MKSTMWLQGISSAALWLASATLGLSAAVGCSSVETDPVGGTGGGGGQGGSGGGGGGDEIVWGECPPNFQSECATVALPLRYDAPDGPEVSILVARRLSGEPDAPQIWLLEGGPGGSGGDFYPIIDLLAEDLPGFDFYTLDHRGVGQSTRLGCDAELKSSTGGEQITAAEWPGCVDQLKEAYGDDLGAFNITNAATDLGRLIERTRAPGQKTFVYGVSYGTTWAMRYLQLFPEQPTAVILDSVVSPNVQFLSRFDEQFDGVAKEYFDLCAADATCSSKVGPDPWAYLEGVYTKIDAGHCAQLGIARPLMRNIMAYLLEGWGRRQYALPLAYRLDRCDPADVDAIVQMANYFFGNPYDSHGSSQALQLNIAFSELWEEPAPSDAELTARADGALFSPDLGPSTLPAYHVWPTYPHDEYTNQWPATEVPILMLAGTLDPQTPYSDQVAAMDVLNGAGQTFVTVPNAPHGVIFQSPVTTDGARPCGWAIMNSFLEDPAAAPDVACLSDLRPVSFETDQYTEAVLGVPDLWENPAPAPKQAAAPAASVDWEAIGRWLRQPRSPLPSMGRSQRKP